jgi:hypothetical protein
MVSWRKLKLISSFSGVCICFCFRKAPRFAQGQYQSGQRRLRTAGSGFHYLITSMGCGASKHAGFVEEAPAAVEEATPAVEEAPAAVEEDAPAVEEAPVYKATADVHPRDGVMLVKGKALLTLAEHEEYGKMTSHQILVVLTKKFKQGKGEKSQKQIMVELGMFQDADFKIVTFVDLEKGEKFTVLTYTWNDSPGTVATRTHTHTRA